MCRNNSSQLADVLFGVAAGKDCERARLFARLSDREPRVTATPAPFFIRPTVAHLIHRQSHSANSVGSARFFLDLFPSPDLRRDTRGGAAR